MSKEEEYSVFNLNQIHKMVFTNYLTFIKSKQNKFVKEIAEYIEDFSHDNVTDVMYSKEDIEDMFIKIKDYIKQSTQKEISDYLNMNAIFVQLLLHDAERQTVTLQVEPSQVENMTNIKEMNEFINSLSNLSSFKGNSGQSKLTSISSTANLIENYETLKHDYDILQQNLDILTKKNEMLKNENANLSDNAKACTDTINGLREQIKVLSSGIKGDSGVSAEVIGKLEAECAQAKKHLDEQIAKYQQLVSDYDKKVSESTQFKQLKKLLQDKNTLIVQLKTKVAKFEEK